MELSQDKPLRGIQPKPKGVQHPCPALSLQEKLMEVCLAPATLSWGGAAVVVAAHACRAWRCMLVLCSKARQARLGHKSLWSNPPPLSHWRDHAHPANAWTGLYFNDLSVTASSNFPVLSPLHSVSMLTTPCLQHSVLLLSVLSVAFGFVFQVIFSLLHSPTNDFTRFYPSVVGLGHLSRLRSPSICVGAVLWVDYVKLPHLKSVSAVRTLKIIHVLACLQTFILQKKRKKVCV